MRTLIALILLTALAALAIVAVRQRQRSQLRDLDTATAPPIGHGGPWPCTAFSPGNAVEASRATWSYRLCGRGSDDRRVEIRFAGTGASLDSVEFRVWLSEPLECDAGAPARSRLIPAADAGESVDSVIVPFGTYHGRIWVCARKARSNAVWQPRTARHGDSP